MRKVIILLCLITLVLISGCGSQIESDKGNDEGKNQVEDTPILDYSNTNEGEYTPDPITQEQAAKLIYNYIKIHIQNSELGIISVSEEGSVTLDSGKDECFTFRASWETVEESEPLGLFAVGKSSLYVYQLDSKTGEYSKIGEADLNSIEEVSTEQGSAGENTNNNKASLDELVASVQQSKSITFELAQDSSKQISYPPEDMSYLMSNFTVENLKPTGYPFLFIPDYSVTCDTGVTFYIMQDRSGDFDKTVIQFEGSDILYTSDGAISVGGSFARLLSPSLEAKMSQMHAFANGVDKESSINAVVNGECAINTALEYFTNNGYNLASMLEDNIFRVDNYTIVDDLSNVAPNLVSIKINYSVKTVSENGSEEWITDNTFVGAIWTDKRDTVSRAYILGLKPVASGDSSSAADIAVSIYEKSLVKALME